MKSLPSANSSSRLAAMVFVAVLISLQARNVFTDDQTSPLPASGISNQVPNNGLKQTILDHSAEATELISQGQIDEGVLTRQKMVLENIHRFLQQEARQLFLSNDSNSAEKETGIENSEDSAQQTSPSDAESSRAGQAPSTGADDVGAFGNLKQNQPLADAVWGHLPPRQRSDLLKTFSEAYHPEYDDRVRQYFERLARIQRNPPPTKTENPERRENRHPPEDSDVHSSR